jgi:hypothetical protein
MITFFAGVFTGVIAGLVIGASNSGPIKALETHLSSIAKSLETLVGHAKTIASHPSLPDPTINKV